MNSPSELSLFGLYRPRPSAPGFAIPVFRNETGLWVQELGEGRVVGFVQCDVEAGQLLPAPMGVERETWVQRVADHPIYAFQMADGHVEVGSREVLAEAIRRDAAQLTNPFVSLDAAEFVGDAKWEHTAREACDRLLHREAPSITEASPITLQEESEVISQAAKASSSPYATQGTVAFHASRAEYFGKRYKQGLAFALGALTIVFAALLSYHFNFFIGEKTPINSLVVLPFINVSDDPNREYLSDGISESLINNFRQLPNLHIVDRTTAFRYKGKEINPQQVGRDLGVEAVLIGRVLQRNDTLMLQVDLVDVGNGSQLWAQQYNGNFNDLVAVQQDISRELVEKLRLRLTGPEKSKLTRRDAGNSEAYRHYLQGRYYWNKRTAEDLKRAAEEFQEAIDNDPNYALPYVGLADYYLLLEEYAGLPVSETLPKAKAAVELALLKDPSLAEAHTSRAKVYQHSWDWNNAETEYKRAIDLNPKYPTARQWYSGLLTDMGRLDEALRQIKYAQELDPLSSIITGNLGYTYFLKGDLASALKEYQKVIENDPTFGMGHAVLGLLYLKEGSHEKAIEELRKAVELSGRSGHALSALGYAYAVCGNRKDAVLIVKTLEEKYLKHETAATNVAGVYAGLGNKNQAFAWLEKDFQSRSYELSRLTSEPIFDTLRSDARYTNLVQRMGLQPR